MLVSIITVCFNSEKTIKKTILSILGQTYSEIEYIIVDGQSSDNTVQIAHSFETAFKTRNFKYKIISEKDNGIYDAMNKGIANATGDIIGIINSDDWYENNAVEIAANAYKVHHYDYMFANLRIIKRNGKSFIKHSKIQKFITTRHWNHPTSFVAKSTYEKYGCYKCIGLYDDLDFYLRIRKNTKNIVVRKNVIANFVVGGASHKKSWQDMKYRFHDKYRCYVDNGYSKFYIIECFLMEFLKHLIS